MTRSDVIGLLQINVQASYRLLQRLTEQGNFARRRAATHEVFYPMHPDVVPTSLLGLATTSFCPDAVIFL